MTKTLALIHTSLVFITVEMMMNDIFAEVMPDVRRINIVDDSLLADVAAAGEITPAVTRRMCVYVQQAESAGADAVLSLCSSLGPTIDVARRLVSLPVIKIDDPMTAEAVRSAAHIGVMATVPTTLTPTVNLIHAKAEEQQKPVQTTPRLVEGAFTLLMAGDRQQHDNRVVEAGRALADEVELIVLAQASMTRLAPRLSAETGLRVLSSPRLAIEYTKQVLDAL